MGEKFMHTWRCIVGPGCGFNGDGNELWYYTLALVINLMLLWSLKPEIALIFTILSVIHYLTVSLCGYFDLIGEDPWVSIAYLSVHLGLIIVAIFTDLLCTVIALAIIGIMCALAPDFTGDNSFYKAKDYYWEDNVPLLFNSIVFIAFVLIDFILPMNLIIKFAIIILMIILHPLIDNLQLEGVIIPEMTQDAINTIIYSDKEDYFWHFYHKNDK